MKSESYDVAKWLAARGFAAFVLKYRTKQLEGNAAERGQSARTAFMAQLDDHAGMRAHASEWGISPDRIVFTGFAAGGMITELTAIQPDARPNYAAPIYGSVQGVPAAAPGQSGFHSPRGNHPPALAQMETFNMELRRY